MYLDQWQARKTSMGKEAVPHFRRDWLKSTAASCPLWFVPASVLSRQGQPAPGNRPKLGFIGVGDMETRNRRGFLRYDDVQVLAVRDMNAFRHRGPLTPQSVTTRPSAGSTIIAAARSPTGGAPH